MGGSSETPAVVANVENQAEGAEGNPGRDRSRSLVPDRGTGSAPSGSAPARPPERKPAGEADGVTGTLAEAEAKANLAKAKENDAALSKITQQRLSEAAEALPGPDPRKSGTEGETEDGEDEEDDKPVILPRTLMNRFRDLTKALQQQGVLHEKHMVQPCGDLEKCSEALADLYRTIKVPAELSASAASTSATTLSIQSDMSECKGLLKQLLETMERAALAAEKTASILAQQGHGAVAARPVAPETPLHADVAPAGPPAAPEGTGTYAAPFPPAYPPQQHHQKGTGKTATGHSGKPGQTMGSQAMAPTRPPAAPPVEPARHPGSGGYMPGWGNSYDSQHRAGGGSMAAGAPSEVPLPANLPPTEIIVSWSGFQPLVAPNMNNGAESNPPLSGELLVEAANLKSTSATGIDRESGRRRRISPEGHHLSHRNTANAAYASKGWTQSVLLFHRVYENL
eukprot:s5667_g1.t1